MLEQVESRLRAREDIEVFFDGECPLCRREVNFLRWLDRRHRIRFTDIAVAGFDSTTIGVDYQRLMSEIHGRMPNGQIIRGVEVLRRLYAAVGLGWLVAASRLPIVAQGLEVIYGTFARNRLRWTRRCNAQSEGSCKRP